MSRSDRRIERDRVKKALLDYLHGGLKTEQFSRVLNTYLRIENRSWCRSFEFLQPLGVEVVVLPSDIESRLQSYLSGELSEEELSIWALILLGLDEYVSPADKQGQGEDYYEPMWEVLQILSSPATDGPATGESVRRHIESLGKLESDAVQSHTSHPLRGE